MNPVSIVNSQFELFMIRRLRTSPNTVRFVCTLVVLIGAATSARQDSRSRLRRGDEIWRLPRWEGLLRMPPRPERRATGEAHNHSNVTSRTVTKYRRADGAALISSCSGDHKAMTFHLRPKPWFCITGFRLHPQRIHRFNVYDALSFRVDRGLMQAMRPEIRLVHEPLPVPRH